MTAKTLLRLERAAMSVYRRYRAWDFAKRLMPGFLRACAAHAQRKGAKRKRK